MYRVWTLLNVSVRGASNARVRVGDGQQGQLALRRQQRHKQYSEVASAEVNKYDIELGLHELHAMENRNWRHGSGEEMPT